MAQITNGVRAVLSHPLLYSSFQSLMGAHKFRTNFVAQFVRPFSGMAILDIGCGPADILAYLPDVDYWGFDISEQYIKKAEDVFGNRGHFHCEQLQANDLERLPKFDVVLAIGLLHHLDDAAALNVLQLAQQALKPFGRLLTVDPCLDRSQGAIARFLVQHDRGQNVRDKSGYEALALSVFNAPKAEMRHQAWIPYTHCIMECEKT
ncbi:MAG: class I SAM-dependent methyltransferase [Pseudomonadota bacterium]|nr:class I SAM-dependent methyltransferase [Pseudomonadota bacterium]MDP1903386.1 class I SAM-dependent methyltransferase [Pseudomonadota bacterium]MDP2352356.1 class I SAM-dependent methyltransferase [Pseudomonadota bacterium]